jgi:hypothetical protein
LKFWSLPPKKKEEKTPKNMETQRQLEEKPQLGPRSTAEGEMTIHDKITLWRRKENESGDMDSFGESMNPDKPDTVRSPDPNNPLASTIGHISHRPFAEYKQ